MNGRIFPVFALFIAVGVFFVYVNPMWTGQIATTRAAIAADDGALASAAKYATQQNQLAAARDAIDATDLSLLETLLPDSVDNVGLILDLNALAARSKFSIVNIDVVTSTPNGAQTNTQASGALPASGLSALGSVDLSLSAVGSFAALQDFLTGVEKSTRLLDVRNLVVKGSNTNVYNYQMTLRLYWLR